MKAKSCIVACTVLLIAVLPMRALDSHPFAREIAAFEASDQTNPPPSHAIVFTGASTIRKWTTLKRDFPNHAVINRGFGGSRFSDADYYFDQIVLPYKPAMIVLYSGSNDLAAHKSVDQVADDFKTFLHKVETELPDAKLAVVSINASPSRWKDVAKVREANQKIAALVAGNPKFFYIDTFSAMLDADGNPRPELYLADRLHPNAKGYEIWKKVIAPYLDRAD